MITRNVYAVLTMAFVHVFGSGCAVKNTTRQDVAAYVERKVLGGKSGGVSIWSTATPLDKSHVARDVDPDVADLPFPFDRSWLVMIDDQPKANWGHTCRWMFVNDNLEENTTPIQKQFPPTVWSNRGAGPEMPFGRLDASTISPQRNRKGAPND